MFHTCCSQASSVLRRSLAPTGCSLQKVDVLLLFTACCMNTGAIHRPYALVLFRCGMWGTIHRPYALYHTSLRFARKRSSIVTVEMRGLEPLTSTVRLSRSPS